MRVLCFFQFKQSQVLLLLHRKQPLQVKAFFFIILNQNLKVTYQNRAFFDVTKCVWIKDKEWMVCDCILTQVIAQTARYIPKFDALFAKLCLLPNYLSSNTTVYDHTNLVWCHAATQKVLWAKRLYLLHYRRTGITTIITIVGK